MNVFSTTPATGPWQIPNPAAIARVITVTVIDVQVG